VTTARTENATDIPSIEALIDEALAPCGTLLDMARLRELHAQLRTEADRLATVVHGRAQGANRGTRDWYAMDSTLAYARDVITEQLASTPLAASLLVRELARQVHALAKWSGEQT
jgi:hypothetical protein